MKNQTNLMIEEEVWRNYKKFCIDKKECASSRIEKFMTREMENDN